MNLYDAIHKQYSEDERKLTNDIDSMSRRLYDKWCYEEVKDKALCDVWYNKEGNKYGVEYGYSMSVVGALVVFMQRMKINSICDLGCGLGLSMYPIQHFTRGIDVYGYDNEQVLIDTAHTIYGKEVFKKRDITELVKEDIRKDSLVYFYEPIYEKSLCQKFIDNLCEILNPNQLVFCRNINPIVGHSFDILSSKVNMELVAKITPNVPMARTISIGAFFKKK